MSSRIAVVDDHRMFRDGVRAILAGRASMEIVGEAADADTAYSVVEQVRPDVVLLDLELQGCSGLTVARRLLTGSPTLHILMLSSLRNESAIKESLQAGAVGFMWKHQSAAELVDALERAARGEPCIPAQVSRMVVQDLIRLRRGERAMSDPLGGLSTREREVFDLLIQGYSNTNISSRLEISCRTVETHRAHIMKKLRVSSIQEVMIFAARHGLLQPA